MELYRLEVTWKMFYFPGSVLEMPCIKWMPCFSVKEVAPAAFWNPDVFLNSIQSLGRDRQEARWGCFCIFRVKLPHMP